MRDYLRQLQDPCVRHLSRPRSEGASSPSSVQQRPLRRLRCALGSRHSKLTNLLVAPERLQRGAEVGVPEEIELLHHALAEVQEAHVVPAAMLRHGHRGHITSMLTNDARRGCLYVNACTIAMSDSEPARVSRQGVAERTSCCPRSPPERLVRWSSGRNPTACGALQDLVSSNDVIPDDADVESVQTATRTICTAVCDPNTERNAMIASIGLQNAEQVYMWRGDLLAAKPGTVPPAGHLPTDVRCREQATSTAAEHPAWCMVT